MGIYKRFVNQAQNLNRTPEVEPSDRIITPANIMTASRPIIAGLAAKRLMEGKRGASLITAVAVATDAEGNVARLLDKKVPDWKIGSSKYGKDGDPVADTAAILEIAGGALLSSKVSTLGKAAIGIVLTQEAVKGAWAVKTAKKHFEETGQKLEIAVTPDGKEAMVEKFVAIETAVATSEVESNPVRLALGLVAVGHAIVGAWRGEQVRQDYQAGLEQQTFDAA